ncbi:T9SS type A sorting domain-containing protein [Maribellus sediminis]|uniref:T9SS type A sorting domain-containing protein n=1 Tax=Maribellus sediminis TaxID=2696285 RepID=UPI001431A107|nr:T9SS type A sorting domain-containing protein [Maribellus sediminis]
MSKIINILATLLFILPAAWVSGQDKIGIGSNEEDIAYSMCEYNNNYFIVGTTCESKTSPANYYVLQLYKNGSIKNEFVFGESHRDVGKDIIVNNNGIYVLGKTWDGGYPNNDMLLSKLNFDGDRQWKSYFGGHHNDLGHSMIQLSDGNFALVGFNRSVDDFGNVYLVKADENGTLIWENNFGDNFVDHGFDVVEDAHGNLYVAGTYGGFYNPTSTHYKNPDADIFIVKTNADGEEIWSKRFGGAGHDWAKSIIASPDGGFFVCGSSQSDGAGSFDVFLMKIDDDGNELWFKTYGGVEFEYGEQVQLSNDNHLYLIGTSASFSNDYTTDHYLVKTDLNGNIIWSKNYGSTESDYSSSLICTEDSGCVFAGWTRKGQIGKEDIVFYKISKNGEQDLLSIIPQINDSVEQILIYPNPVNDRFFVEVKSDSQSSFKIQLYNLNGAKVYSGDVLPNSKTVHKPIISSGTYIYTISQNSQIVYKGKLTVAAGFQP